MKGSHIKYFLSFCILLFTGYSQAHASNVGSANDLSQTAIHNLQSSLNQLQNDVVFISSPLRNDLTTDLFVEVIETEEETRVSALKRALSNLILDRAFINALALQMHFRTQQEVPFYFEPVAKGVKNKRFVVFQDFRI